MAKILDDIVKLEEKRVMALEDQDARAYTRLCDQLGVTDIEDSILYGSGAGYDKAEELYFSQLADKMLEQEESVKKEPVKKPRKKRVRKNQVKYDELREVSNAVGIKVNKVFEDTAAKIRYLRNIMGYTHLFVGKDEKIRLEDAKPNRVGEAYKKCYEMGEQ